MAIGSAFFALTSLLTSAAQITLAWDVSTRTSPSVTGYRWQRLARLLQCRLRGKRHHPYDISNLVGGMTWDLVRLGRPRKMRSKK